MLGPPEIRDPGPYFLGIGTTAPGAPLTIANLGTGGTTALQVDASGNVFKAASSLRYKDNV